MNNSSYQPFEPPTALQVNQLLTRYPATGPSPWLARLPLVVTILVGATLILASSVTFTLLAWLAMGGLFIYFAIRAKRARELEAKLNHAQELAMLRYEREALRTGWRLLPDLTQLPPLHARCLTILSHCLERLKSFEAAMVIFDHLLEHMPSDFPATLQLRIQKTIAALECDHLSDADQALRALRPQVETPHAPPPLKAGYTFAALIQHVRTAHFAEAVEQPDNLLDDLRPLGIEAAYGHALIALSYHRMAEKQPPEVSDTAQAPDTPEDPDTPNTSSDSEQSQHPEDEDRQTLLNHAANWWQRATLLMPAQALLYRFPELRPFTSETSHD